MDDFNLLRVFVRVAEARNFAEAGRRLGLTASAVSKAVSRLESSMGARLLNRTTRHVGLTNDGAEFFERCVQILADIEAAETQLQRSVAEPRGRLRVHIPVGFGRKVVLPALAKLGDRYPDLLIDVELGERNVDLAEDGLDAAIRFGEQPSSGLLARRLCNVHFVACAAPSYLDRRGVPLRPEDLEQHSCIGYATRWSAHYREWKFSRDGVPFSLNLSGRLNINNVESMLDAAIAGSGIAMLASYMVSDAVREGSLKIVLRDFIAPATPVFVVYLPGRQRAPRVQLFLDVLKDLIPANPAWNEI
ncbi:LysR family transcriptional regulator [Aquabacter sp. CN5-332]|uniref:LysR family transcriptional regulator n=1 Tax=Aquabacter sp. CN5-332 TaxID=3156608 RepID=UPI0032B5DB1F